MTTTRAADDQKRFAEGFTAGWHLILGYRALPTIIPDYEVPMGKPPFEYGYEQARAFACHAQEDTYSFQTRPISVFRCGLNGAPFPQRFQKFDPYPRLFKFPV